MKIPPNLPLIKGGIRTASSPDEAQRNPGAVHDPGFHFMGEARYPLGIPSGLHPPLLKGDRGGFFTYFLIALLLHACGGGGFDKLPQSPTVTTVQVDAAVITPKSITLTGVVNPNSDATTAWFEWGPDETYANKTEETDVGNGAEDVAISVLLENQLTPNTLYYYRLAARNHLDTIYGAGMTFTTPVIPLPTLAPIRSATETQSLNCTLMGITVNPNGYDTQAWFEYGLGTTYGSVTTPGNLGAGAIDIDFSQAIPAYTLGTTYHYRALAQNEGGAVTSEDNQCTTPAAGVISPADPPTVTTLAPTTITPVSVTLNGEGNPLGTDSVGWFEWGTTASYSNKTIEQSLGNGTTTQPYTQDITGLQPDTEYHFRAVARGYGNISVYGSDQITRTARTATVNTAIATSLTPTGLRMNAAINPNGFTTSAWFEWGTTTAYGNTTAERLVGSTNNSQSFSEVLTGLTPSTQYHYRIIARGYGNQIITGLDQIAATQPVPPPTVTTSNPSLVTVDRCAFNGTVNPNGFDTDAWFEWGNTTSYGTPTGIIPLGTGSINVPLSAVISGLTTDTSYHYRLVAQNDGGLVYGSDAVCTTTSLSPVAPVISNIAVTTITTTSAVISWETTVLGSSRIDYNLTSGYGFNVTDTTLTTTHSLTIPNLAPSTVYHYQVTSVDGANTVHTSGDATFTTLDAPLTSINVAQGKTGIASSTNAGYSTSAPLDGVRDQTAVTNLMWSPATANAGEWYTVDLQALYTIDQVRLTMGSNTTAYTTTRGFTIDTSADGTTWATQATVNNNTEFTKIITFAPIEARFVRFTITQGSALNGLSYLIELEVYQAFFVTTGTYTSAIHDMGQANSFPTISWTETLNGQTLTLKARTCDDILCTGEPDFSTLTNLTNGAALSDGGGAVVGHRYVQYQSTLTTTNIYKTPSLESVTVNTTNNSWTQTDDSTTEAGFNLEGHAKTYTQVTNQNGGNIQLSKPPRGGIGQDGAYTCLTGVCTNLPGGVYNFTSFYVAQGAIVDVPKGGPALVIYSQGDVTINGALRINGGDGANYNCLVGGKGIAGAGGHAGGKGGCVGYSYPQNLAESGEGAGGGVAGSNSPNPATGVTVIGSGGGGGFGGAGGSGITNTSTSENGGGTNGIPLNGGSGGGGGVAFYPPNQTTTPGGAGGGGGGMLRISTSSNIYIGVSGLVQANGGNGGLGQSGSASGGGGSGGGIQLEAIAISNDGALEMKGGNSIGAVLGGGGGGGRITFYDNDGVISGSTGQINVNGGTGFAPGGHGVVDIYKLY